MLHFVRLAASVVLGYGVMVALLTLVQEAWLGGVRYGESGQQTLLLAAICSFFSAVAGGFVAALVAGHNLRLAALWISGLVVVETAALLLTDRLDGPLWFDLGGAASLIAGIVIGAEIQRGRRARAFGS